MNRVLSLSFFFFLGFHSIQSQVQVKLGGGYGVLAYHQDESGPPLDLFLTAQLPINKYFHAGLGLRYLGNVYAEGYYKGTYLTIPRGNDFIVINERGERNGLELMPFVGVDFWRLSITGGMGLIFSSPTTRIFAGLDSEESQLSFSQRHEASYNTTSYWNTTARLEFLLLNSKKYNIAPYVQLVRPLGEKFVQHTTDTPIVLDPAFDEFPFFEENIGNIGRINKGGLKTFVGVLLSYNL